MVIHHEIICEPTNSSIVDQRKKTCSLRDFCRVYLTVFSKWCCINQSIGSSSSPSCKSRRSSRESSNHSSSPYDFSDQETGEETEEKGSMKGGQRYIYNGDNTPTSSGDRYFKHKSVDHCYSPSPKNGSRKISPAPSFLCRSKTRGSIESPNGNISRNASSRKPIMFSNSTGLLKPAPLHKALECTLEELCYGCKKKIKVTRDVVTKTGEIIQEDEMLTINVKPGWKKGTKVTFEGMGNERPGSVPADITFVIAEKKHALFRREGDNLELKIEIPLIKALTGCEISIPLLGGNKLPLVIEDIIYPGFHKIVKGQGMPNMKDHGKRGDLKVVFLVEFPTQLTEDQRLELVKILEDSC